MKHTPKIIKRTLKRCIQDLSSHPELYCKNPEKDFTRADDIRRELDSKGIVLNDNINGTSWDVKSLYV